MDSILRENFPEFILKPITTLPQFEEIRLSKKEEDKVIYYWEFKDEDDLSRRINDINSKLIYKTRGEVKIVFNWKDYFFFSNNDKILDENVRWIYKQLEDPDNTCYICYEEKKIKAPLCEICLFEMCVDCYFKNVEIRGRVCPNCRSNFREDVDVI